MRVFRRTHAGSSPGLIRAAAWRVAGSYIALGSTGLCLAKASFIIGTTASILALTAVAALLLRAERRRCHAAASQSCSSPDQSDAAASADEDARADAQTAACRDVAQHMADAVEAQLGTLVEKVGGRAQAMRAIADTVAGIAERSGENIVCSRMAADDSAEASRALALTTTDLERSIATIGDGMNDVNRVACEGVAVGAEARATMSQLTQQLGRVRQVTGRITGLARQTNLLALNATIEAARAGAAGSAFAVVAAEVKALAHETTTLTAEIALMTSDLETVNTSAVNKVGAMEDSMSRIQAIAANVTTDLQEQRDATSRMAQSVQQTADAAGVLCTRVDSLTESMLENLDQIGAIHVATGAMIEGAEGIAADLRYTITKAMRTAVPAADRRRHQRIVLSESQQRALPTRISVAGRDLPVRLLDISDSGCRVAAQTPIPLLNDGALHIPSLGVAVKMEIVTQETHGETVFLGIKFVNPPVAAASLAVLGQDETTMSTVAGHPAAHSQTAPALLAAGSRL